MENLILRTERRAKMKRLQINAIRILFLGLFIFIMIKGRPVLWLGIFGASLVAALLFGRIFCGWICPMNTLMIPTETLAGKLGVKLKGTPKSLESGWLAWVLLAGFVAAMVIVKKTMGVQIPVLLYLLVIAVLAALRYKPEVFHNKICPFGALQSLTGRFARFSRKVDTDKCVGCKLCEAACPSTSIVVAEDTHKAAIDSRLCHQCYNCSLICPKEAVYYGKNK